MVTKTTKDAICIMQDKINNTKSPPAVSVILPVYNVQQYIRQCMDSIITQTLSNIEIICVDDGSSDGCLAILMEYAQRDHRISVLKQKNAGAGIARNTGMACAKGEYLIFLDADDFFATTLLADLYEKAQVIDADMVVCLAQNYDNKTGKLYPLKWGINSPETPKLDFYSKENFANRLFNTFGLAPWNKLFRRSFIEKEKIFFQELKTANDVFFVTASLALASRIAILRKQLIFWRSNRAESLTKVRDRSVGDYLLAWKKLRDLLELRGLFYPLKQSFVNAVINSTINESKVLSVRARAKLHDELRNKWLTSLDLIGHPDNFFYHKKTYKEFQKIINNTHISFNTWKYYKYKFSSKITFGDMRLRHQLKFDELKQIRDFIYTNKIL